MSRDSGSAYHHSSISTRGSAPHRRGLEAFWSPCAFQAYRMLISIERDDWAEQCESKTMKILMDKTLRFWIDIACGHIERDQAKLTQRQLVAQILRIYEQRGDAMRYLNEQGKIGWKASPRFLMMLADAERDARDDLAEFP
jgi:hypothetical protein